MAFEHLKRGLGRLKNFILNFILIYLNLTLKNLNLIQLLEKFSVCLDQLGYDRLFF